MVVDGGPLLMRTWMHQIYLLKKNFDIEVIWVTSGAIAWAVQRTEFAEAKKTLPQKQALSAIGQPLIMDQYNLAIHANGLLGSQVLLTAGDIKDKARAKNLKNTLNQLLSWNVIPLLNENDAVSTEEIKFGDNDSLASKVAVMMKADRLILMTDVEGLFDQDPKQNPDAKLVPYLKSIGPKELKLANRKTKTAQGTGGMYSKIQAAGFAGKHGIVTHLVLGDLPENLVKIAKGQKIGTQIGGKF